MRDTSYKQTITPAQLMTIHYHEARTVQDLKQNDDGPRTQQSGEAITRIGLAKSIIKAVKEQVGTHLDRHFGLARVWKAFEHPVLHENP